MSPKVVETCLTVLLLGTAVVVWQLKPERSETKFPFVYFFDHERGKFIDLVVPGLYHLENSMLMNNEAMLKKYLKDDFFEVSFWIAEYMVYKQLNLTPFGAKNYKPSTRIVHLGTFTGPSNFEFNKELKIDRLSALTIKDEMGNNVFKEFIEKGPSPFSYLAIPEIKIPFGTKLTVKRTKDNKGKLNQINITLNKTWWYDLTIQFRVYSGGIIGNWNWAKQNLKIHNNENNMNDYYDSIGEMDIKWELKAWSIGHPDAEFYRSWLTAVEERLKNNFDWNLKTNALSLDGQFVK